MPETTCRGRRGPAHAGPGRPHATTIVALRLRASGVVIAGDRRATMGNMIAQRDIEKVFITDSYSAVGIAGSAGIAVRDGAALHRRARALREDRGRAALPRRQDEQAGRDGRGNLGRRPAGLRRRAAVRRLRRRRRDPAEAGRIVTFDATGGRYEERLGFHAVGSGSVFARGRAQEAARHRRRTWPPRSARPSRRSTTPPTTTPPRAARTSSAGIYPVVVIITGDGAVRRPAPTSTRRPRAVVPPQRRGG